MSFNKKTWTDRISEFITRRLLTKADGSTEQVTVSRDEGEITQEGTPLNAESFNDLEGRIESAFSDTDDAISQLNTHLTETNTLLTNKNSLKLNGLTSDIKFGIDADGNYGYIKDGADTVTPFSKGTCEVLFSTNNAGANNGTNTNTITKKDYAVIIVFVMGGGKPDEVQEGGSSSCYANINCDSYSTNTEIFNNALTKDSGTRGEVKSASIFYKVPQNATITTHFRYEGCAIVIGIN